jgi:hypothetical protein
MKEPAKTFVFIIYTILFTLVVWGLYGDQFQLWNDQIPGSGEDGAKNYYTVAYHIEHDTSFQQFDGMNYPYGEHVVYTDNQPFFSNILRVFGAFADMAIYLVFLSAFTGGWCLYLILKRHELIWWFALISALGITLLSPQFLRLGGHYSLAYAGLIPVVFYFILRSKSIPIGSVVPAFLLLISGFIHPYFLLMLSVFWGCFLLANQVADRKLKNIKSWSKTILLPLVPLLAFQIILFITDVVTDRPSSPYGFLFYRATWASVFIPIDFPYFEGMSHMFTQSMEGGAFVGWFAIIGLGIGIRDLIKGRSGSIALRLLIAALPLLLISVAFPFYIWKFDRLLEYIGPLQQFRGIARFSFVFFYAINIYAAVQIGKFIKESVASKRLFFGIAALAILEIDVWNMSQQVIDKTSSGTSVFHDKKLNTQFAKFSKQEYQAIIPLPYFHIGSENFRTADESKIKEYSFALSLQSGLPLTCVQMSRTSLTQTLSQLDMMSFLETLPEQLSNEKASKLPYLLLIKQHANLTAAHIELIRKSTRVGLLDDGFELRSLPVEAFSNICSENRKELSMRSEFAFSITEANYQSFDDIASERSFSGQGAKQLQRIDWTDLCDPMAKYSEEVDYELSFWFFADDQHAVNTQIWLWERDLDGNEIRFEVSEVGDHLTQVMNGWILCTLPINVQSNWNKIQIMLHRDGEDMSIWIDEVLIRNTRENFTKQGSLNLNNRYIEPPR